MNEPTELKLVRFDNIKDENSNDTKEVVKAIIVSRDGRILLLQPKTLFKWHLPGGHVQTNETHTDALKREIKEETDLDLAYYYEILSKGNFRLYFCKPKNRLVKLSQEHSKFVWSPLTDLFKYNLTQDTYKDLKYIMQIRKALLPLLGKK